MAAVQAPRSRLPSSTVAVGLKIAAWSEANENNILVGAPITGTKDQGQKTKGGLPRAGRPPEFCRSGATAGTEGI